ncbi:piezo-type mechanosensitive ion channel component-like [Periplaneta americana]|uniref:piezo-type mechanosensitive ion channel component-like n=1 Tax=Periplaneta americana TaxID=6978 RepID=UPI0037E9A008
MNGSFPTFSLTVGWMSDIRSEMVRYYSHLLLMRIVLPSSLSLSVLCRYNSFSFIYLLLLLILPWIKVPTNISMKGATGIYLLIVMAVSVVISFMQLCYQVIFKFVDFRVNSTVQSILWYLGFTYVGDLHLVDAIFYLSPEILMFITSIAVFFGCKKLTADDAEQEQKKEPKTRYQRFVFLMGNCLMLMSFCASGVLCPSILNAVYFLAFIIGMTMWSWHKKLLFVPVMLMFTGAITSVHIIALYSVQLQFVQEIVLPYHKYCRYLGITILVDRSSSDQQAILKFVEADLTLFLNPLSLLWLHYIIGIQWHYFKDSKLVRKLLQLGDTRKSSSEVREHTTYQPVFWDHLLDIFYDIVDLIRMSSYIATNIVMMVWSITYHSWLTFVWLLWACLLWILPNQRFLTFKCSPYLLLYAFLLLCCQYLYSMNLTEDELPEEVNGVSLKQIGLSRIPGLPCVPLIIKSLYTLFFWMNVYQEQYEHKVSLQLGIRSPLLISTATQVLQTNEPRESPRYRSRVTTHLADFLHKLFIKFWILVVLCMLLVLSDVIWNASSITLFNIIFMTIFLTFVITLQLSYDIWRRFLYVFWLVIIVATMIILVQLYIYQFHSVHYGWTHYLNVSEQIQHDIGLEFYNTSDLFLQLLYPSLLLVATVVQLRCFHNDFMIYTEIKPRSPSELRVQTDSNGEPSSLYVEENKSASSFSFHGNKLSMKQMHYFKKKILKFFDDMVDFIWIFLELHILKIMVLSILFLCVYDTCAINFVFLCMVVVSLSIGSRFYKLMTEIVSVLISGMLLGMMIYQLSYFKPDESNYRECKVNSTTKSNVDWLGIYKNKESYPVMTTFRFYLTVIALATSNAIIAARKMYKYGQSSDLHTPLGIIFPNIERKHADRDILSAVKYFLNYGFFKFGVEVCLTMNVILISKRMDMYSIIHLIWLCVLTFLNRRNQEKIWNIYQCFLVALIPLQYAMIVGLPPSLCIEYPWENSSEVYGNLQQWMLLPDNYYPPSAYKLIYDFILLMLVFQQRVVFHKQKLSRGKQFPGGDNDDVYQQAEYSGFINPVPDHLTYTRSWLDVVKRCVFSSFPWVIVALLFLTGTQQSSVICLGYVLLSFTLLWKGDALFLYPVSYTLQQWNKILIFNLTIILFKNWRQIIAILYQKTLKLHACWLAQLLYLTYHKMMYTRPISHNEDAIPCIVTNDSGLEWDATCYVALLLMKRFCKSYYFVHHINQCKIATILMFRGAEIIEENIKTWNAKQEAEESKVLTHINFISEKIEGSHKKQEPPYKEPGTHDDAVFSGDYSLFAEADEHDMEDTEKPYLDPELIKHKRHVTVSQFMSEALRTDVEKAADMTLKQDELSSDEEGKVSNTSVKTVSQSEKHRDSGEAQKKEKKKIGQRIWLLIKILWALYKSIIETLTCKLNDISQDYRYIRIVMSREKRVLMDTTLYQQQGVRDGPHMKWRLRPEDLQYIKIWLKTAKTKEGEEDEENKSKKEWENISPSESHEIKTEQHMTIWKLLLALWMAFQAHTDLICYVIIFWYHMESASILSLPLPLMVLLWGTLSLPRPSVTFWVTVIVYSEVIIVLKWLFHIRFLLWTYDYDREKSPLYPIRIIGFETKKLNLLSDLILLLMIFFHRSMLKSLGLWLSKYEIDLEHDDQEFSLDEEGLHPLEKHKTTESKEVMPLISRGHESSSKMILSHLSSDLIPEPIRSNSKKKILLRMKEEDLKKNLSFSVALGLVKEYCSPVSEFFSMLLHPPSHGAVDVYAFMFFCELFNFVLTIFGYSAFGSDVIGDTEITSYLEEDRVPTQFLIIMLIQFTLIVIDRALYLRKFIIGKIIFQIFLIIIIHVWMFFLLPYSTGKQFNKQSALKLWYMVKCFYLLLGAYQIRQGFPFRIIGNFLCKKYGIMNKILFKGFMWIPFLFEIRTLMDWIWTDTSLSMFQWLKMEDIFAYLFDVKCSRQMDQKYPSIRGAPKGRIIKYSMGGGLLLVIFAAIWFPLLIFALAKYGNEPSLPHEVTVTMDINDYYPIYTMSAEGNKIVRMNRDMREKMRQAYMMNKEALIFLSMHTYHDMAIIQLASHSQSMWEIPSPQIDLLIEDLQSENLVTVTFSWSISRIDPIENKVSTATGRHEHILKPLVGGKPNPERVGLLSLLRRERNSALIYNIFPKYIRITNRGHAISVPHLMERIYSVDDRSYRNLTLSYDEGNYSNGWWSLKESCDDYNYEVYLKKLNFQEDQCNNLVMVTFSDTSFPKALSFLTGKGIISLYLGSVYILFRLFRNAFGMKIFKIIYLDMPYVDRILQLCSDIYLVRENQNFILEEDLYAKLIFLFRSPELLIKWTRPPHIHLQ